MVLNDLKNIVEESKMVKAGFDNLNAKWAPQDTEIWEKFWMSSMFTFVHLKCDM